jgi:predicted MFS family arabinose efflux permease
MLATAGGFALLAVAPGVGVLYGLLFLAGVAIAPGFSCIYDLVGRTTPPEVSVEAFSWVASAIQLGAAAGAAVGGVLVQASGTRTAVLCAALVGVGTATVGVLGRRYFVREHVAAA